MNSLEETRKNHTINFYSSSYNSSSHGHVLFSFGFSFNATTTSYFNEWLIYFGASYHMVKDKTIFSSINECNTKQIFVGDDISLSV
jgi:hypothetical protein